MPESGVSSLSESLQQFERAAQAVEATVEYVRRSGEAVKDAVLRKAAGSTPIVVAQPRRLPPEYFAELLIAQGVLSSPSVEEFRTAPVGVSEAFAGVAATGSVCVEICAGINGFASLIPRLHIAVVDSDEIVPRPRDVMTSEIGLQSDFVFITGPSATADMGPLVRGVHGPHKLHILVLR